MWCGGVVSVLVSCEGGQQKKRGRHRQGPATPSGPSPTLRSSPRVRPRRTPRIQIAASSACCRGACRLLRGTAWEGLVQPGEPDAKVKFLAAEALRGVGGVLLDINGNRFCNELGRRDYVTGREAPEHLWLLLAFEWQGIGRDRVALQALQGSWYHEGVQEHGRVCQSTHPRSKLEATFKAYNHLLLVQISPLSKTSRQGSELPTPSRCRWPISSFSVVAWESILQRRAVDSPSRSSLSSRAWRCYR